MGVYGLMSPHSPAKRNVTNAKTMADMVGTEMAATLSQDSTFGGNCIDDLPIEALNLRQRPGLSCVRQGCPLRLPVKPP